MDEIQDKKLYGKNQLLTSKRYTASQKDILSVILEKDSTYSHEQVTEIINNFLCKEAK